jgi:hypothetical protein
MTGLGHTTKRFVYESKDLTRLQLHHAEAFRSIASIQLPTEVLKWKPATSTTNSTFDDAKVLEFEDPITVPAIVNLDATKEKLKKLGIDENADGIIYLSYPILRIDFDNLVVDNRDRIRRNGVDYDIISTDDPTEMGDNTFEIIYGLRRVQ